MPKNASQKLRRRLKAADKRRQSRPQTSAPTQTSPKQAGVDVLGLLVEITVQYSADHPSLQDAAVVAALRGVQSGLSPSGEHSKPLFVAYMMVAERDDVSTHQLRAAAKKMFELAAQHRSKEPSVINGQDSTPFLTYLGLLV